MRWLNRFICYQAMLFYLFLWSHLAVVRCKHIREITTMIEKWMLRRNKEHEEQLKSPLQKGVNVSFYTKSLFPEQFILENPGYVSGKYFYTLANSTFWQSMNSRSRFVRVSAPCSKPTNTRDALILFCTQMPYIPTSCV